MGCGGLEIPQSSDATTDAVVAVDAVPLDDAFVDASSDVSTFVLPDASLLDPCRDASSVIHVDVDGGYPIDASSATLTNSVGTWSCAETDESYLQLSAQADASWAVAIGSDWTNNQSISVGTFTSSGDDHKGSWMQLQVAGQGCFDVPTGTFTIYDLAVGAGDQATVSRLAVGFVLHCTNGSTASGCATFGE